MKRGTFVATDDRGQALARLQRAGGDDLDVLVRLDGFGIRPAQGEKVIPAGGIGQAHRAGLVAGGFVFGRPVGQ